MIRRFAKISALLIVFLIITGTTAYLTLTFIIKSEDTVVVPDLLGKDVVYSLEILTDLGLNTKIKGSEYSDDFPKNHVILQDPLPGAEIKKGRDLRILLSRGPKVITMPNVIGLPVRQARLLLEESGLCSGNDTYVHDKETSGKDVVIAQDPLYGILVNRGRCVNLLVSMGQRPRAYQMPDLSGLSVDEAVIYIERSHLQVGRFRYEFHQNQPDNVIVDQYPDSGYRVLEKTPIDLVVNRKPGPGPKPNTNQAQRSGFFRHKMDSGFLNKHVQVRLDSMGVSSELYNNFMGPGQELWLLVPTNTIATLFLYIDGELVKTQVYNEP
ncbi:MAG: PASTA domain-containing protein [Desulfobacterales bacterium]|nr:PASTA domain-containing protein [Desulfobacterales bacterium]MDX2511701.1 PASTA domain-containing protein [Desulfobacterales bacterium]